MVSQARVLHVEDDGSFADMASSFLERVDDGISVDTEPGASDGLDALKEKEYDCIISDYEMPGMDGIEFLERVRERNPDIPFFLYTAKGSEEIASEAISVGVTDYMQKDTGRNHFQVLANRVQNAVDTYRSAREATRERDRLEQTLATISTGVLLVDEHGSVEYANDKAREIVDVEEVTAEKLSQFRDAVVTDSGITEIDGMDGIKTVVVDTPANATSDGSAEDGKTHTLEQSGQGGKQTIPDAIGDPVYVLDEGSRFRYVNDALVELSGYSRDQLVGEHVSHILTTDDTDRHSASVLSDDGTESVKTDVEIQCRDGTTVDCEAHVTEAVSGSDSGGVIGVLREIAERKEFEEELCANETALRELYEAAADHHDSFEEELEALITAGCNRLDLPFGYVTRVSNGQQTIVANGGDAEFNVGVACPIDETYCRKTIDSEAPITVSHASSEGWADDRAYDRFSFEVYVGGRLVDDEGVYGTICFGSKEGRSEFSELQLAFLDVIRRMAEGVIQRHKHVKTLERQNERLEEFASTVSHDIRNPLQIAMGNLQMLNGDVDHPAIEHVDDQLDRIDELIDSLLDYAYNGTDVQEFEAVDLDRAATEAWGIADTPEATIRFDDNLPSVLADGSRMRELLENLFANAIEHVDPDVTVRVGKMNNGFFVADDGPGLPEDDVFTPGYTTDHDGTGFGLAIVKEIAEAHGWEVVTTTDPILGGARFEFTGVDFAAEISQ